MPNTATRASVWPRFNVAKRRFAREHSCLGAESIEYQRDDRFRRELGWRLGRRPSTAGGRRDHRGVTSDVPGQRPDVLQHAVLA
jgi:hypothetical protein